MSQLQHEPIADLIPLRTACKRFPARNGRTPHLQTLMRWCRSGVNGVKLRSVKVGSVVFTSDRYIREFLAETSRR